MTFERRRLWRAIVTCTTCNVVVATGPEADDPAMAAYLAGGGLEGPIHLGTCAGGALDVTTEELPEAAPPAAPSSPARLEVVR